MADEKKEPWLNWLALTTVILAVCATLSTFKGGSYSTRSVLSQTRAANQWAYYQAKSIKGYLYEIQKEELELGQQADGDRRTPAVRAQVEKRLAGYREKLARYEQEKAEIQAEAKRFEAVRDDATVHSQTFGMSHLPAGRHPALVGGRAAEEETTLAARPRVRLDWALVLRQRVLPDRELSNGQKERRSGGRRA